MNKIYKIQPLKHQPSRPDLQNLTNYGQS